MLMIGKPFKSASKIGEDEETILLKTISISQLSICAEQSLLENLALVSCGTPDQNRFPARYRPIVPVKMTCNKWHIQYRSVTPIGTKLLATHGVFGATVQQRLVLPTGTRFFFICFVSLLFFLVLTNSYSYCSRLHIRNCIQLCICI